MPGYIHPSAWYWNKKTKNIATSLHCNGIEPRVHGNKRRLPHTLSSVEYVIHFLLQYSEQHALLLPGRIPGYSTDVIKLLPSSTSKRKVWQIYLSDTQHSDDVKSVAYRTFCLLSANSYFSHLSKV